MKGETNLDYVIVLGTQIHESGPSIVLKYRLDAAVLYLNENPGTICIVSGGQGKNEPYSEAEGMAKYLIEKGIPEKEGLSNVCGIAAGARKLYLPNNMLREFLAEIKFLIKK